MKTAIVGAGIAGLAAAVRLAARGDEVEVFEANAYPGGKLSEFEQDGYRFDAGPSLFTMPQYVEALFEAAEEDPSAHFSYERLPVVCRYFWEDGTDLTAYADPQAFAQEVEDKLGVPAQTLLGILADSRHKYEVSGRIFLEKSLHRLSTWLDWSVVKALFKIPGMDLFTTMNAVHERDAKHPKLVQLLNRFATYNGSNPYKAPGLLSIIPHFEHGIGAFIPRGGMHAITQAVYQLALRQGVRFHFNTPADEITVSQGRVDGIRTGAVRHAFDRVVCNMDVFFAYSRLLPSLPPPQRILQQQKSTSALIFYWGVQRSFPELDLHNIFFSDNYRQEFEELEAGRLSPDPTVYVNITSKYCPEDAPDGCESWFVMLNAPCNKGQDWDSIIHTARQNALDKLSRLLGTDMRALIATEAILDPRSIERKTSSHLGSLYGTSSNSRTAAFMRHANMSRQVKNLYFCGGSVHPGGGIPLCLLSAKIVDDLIAEGA